MKLVLLRFLKAGMRSWNLVHACLWFNRLEAISGISLHNARDALSLLSKLFRVRSPCSKFGCSFISCSATHRPSALALSAVSHGRGWFTMMGPTRHSWACSYVFVLYGLHSVPAKKIPELQSKQQTSEPTVAESTKDAKSDLASPSVSKDTEQHPVPKLKSKSVLRKNRSYAFLAQKNWPLKTISLS